VGGLQKQTTDGMATWQEVWLYSAQVMFLLHIQAGSSVVSLAAELLSKNDSYDIDKHAATY